MEIYRINHIDGHLLYEGEAEDFKSFVESKKHDLCKAVLRYENLSGVDLRNANLKGTDLRHSILLSADLFSANLSGADLHNAILIDTNLIGTNLSEANLSYSNLNGANLNKANLFKANLFRADFTNANLISTELSYVQLIDVNLIHTCLSNANLNNTCIPIFSNKELTFFSRKPNITIEDICLDDVQIKISCTSKTIAEWDKWFAGTEEFETKRGTFEFRQIEAHYEAVKAYLLKLYGGNK